MVGIQEDGQLHDETTVCLFRFFWTYGHQDMSAQVNIQEKKFSTPFPDDDDFGFPPARNPSIPPPDELFFDFVREGLREDRSRGGTEIISGFRRISPYICP